MNTFRTNFLDSEQIDALVVEHGTPLFVYSRAHLIAQARTMLNLPAPHGLRVRYAMKANPHPEILAVLRDEGIDIDASSGYEAEMALKAGFSADRILLTSQQLAHNLTALVSAGVAFNATSLKQLVAYGMAFPNTTVTVRLNPGIGSGHSAKTNVGGLTSSFGIWHEYIPRVHEIAAEYGLTINRVHTHIGSGTDPAVWHQSVGVSLALLKQFPDATTVNLGGGFKVGRMDDEQGTDASLIGQVIADELEKFKTETGRELQLELEPGTFLVANAGILLVSVEDITDTGSEGFNFLKLNTGMNDILRPSLYGAQHPIAVVNKTLESTEYVVVGHNCESGDLLTPAKGEPDVLGPRRLATASLGDSALIGGVGAYCASMSAQGYNSYPVTPEIII